LAEAPGERGWRRTQHWLPAAYAVLAGAWIIVSDRALLAASPGSESLARWTVLKGWAP
jgi:hypothetical protein